VRSAFLPFCTPSIGSEEVEALTEALTSNWLSAGPKVRRFEHEFAEFVGAPAALGVDSCTAALHLGLLALGVGPGDRVITTPMTFCSSIHVIEHVGAQPVLVDVEPDTLNIDPAAVRRVLAGPGGARVKALLPVHLYGHPCDMEPLVGLAERYGLSILEDAAHALPASYRGRRIGSGWNDRVPTLSCFSFYATKNLTTGEGGMLTGPPDLIEQARMWSLHGMSRDAFRRYSAEGSWRYDVDRAGFKYNMTDLTAALGLQQLRKLPQFQTERERIVRQYDEAFKHDASVEVPVVRPDVEHARHLYVLRLNLDRFDEQSPGDTRARFIEELQSRNIGVSVHFIPVHMHGYYRDKYGYKPDDYPVAYREYQRIVSLPLYPRMTAEDVADVVREVRGALESLAPARATTTSARTPVPARPEIPGKRMFDMAVATAVLILGAPVWALLAFAIWLESGRPVIHRAVRIGLGGRPFTMFKFRSMVPNAAKLGPAVTLPDDPRVTRVGRILRFLKLDEMPQLLNILRGDLSIVGPRPEDPRYVALYTTQQREVFAVRPGLTNPAMIKYRHEQDLLAGAGGDHERVYLEVHLPDRLRMDLEYIDRRSFVYDLQILLQAVLSLFRKREIATTNLLKDPAARVDAVLVRYRRMLIVVAHAVLVPVAYYLAFFLRFDFNLPQAEWDRVIATVPLLLGLRLAAFAAFRLYRGLWRYFSIADAAPIVKAITASSAIFGLAVFLFADPGFPRSVLLLDWLLCLALAVGFRVGMRTLWGWRRQAPPASKVRHAVIIGAGDAGEVLAREIARNRATNYRVIGFVDDDPAKQRRRIHNIGVIGTLDQLPDICASEHVHEVLVAISFAQPDQLRRIRELCRRSGVPFRTVPNLVEFLLQEPESVGSTP
jgi:dTDP-4-amino-4,6-dideoxygalactose transaminase/lipopolysaccharide/colanic/teichoic acid biosynthesis glycosyltransferase